MKKKAVAAAIAAVLASGLLGCAGWNKPNPPPAMQFSYTTNNGPAAGLVRAFVLNGSTVLQFIDISQAQPRVFLGDQATPAPYQVIGQYAILSGVHPALRVVANGATATVAADALQGAMPGLQAQLAATQAPEPAKPNPITNELQEARRQLEDARARVDELKREIAGGPAAEAPIRPASLIVPATTSAPAGEPARTWTLNGNRTLKDNLADLARQAGYAEPTWRAANPYMVTYTTKYTGTFQEVIGKIAEQVPALDFRVYSWKKTIEVAEASNG